VRYRRKSSRGSALIIAMIALGVLTAILATSLERSSVDTRMAGVSNKRVLASEIAETQLGLWARRALTSFNTTGSLNAFLTQYQGSSWDPPAAGSTP